MTYEWLSNSTHEPLFNKASDANTFLGTLDALFMLCYAAALVFWGWLGDRWNSLHVVVLGMFGSAVAVHFFFVVFILCYTYEQFEFLANTFRDNSILYEFLFDYLLYFLLCNFRLLSRRWLAK